MQTMTLMSLMMMTTTIGCVEPAPRDAWAGMEADAGARAGREDAGIESDAAALGDAGVEADSAMRRDAALDDAALRDDAGALTPGDAGRARLSLSVEQAWFRERAALRLAIEVRHEGGAGATLEAEDFAVVSESGERSSGADEGLFLCEGALSAGASRRCTLGFTTEDSPVFLQHTDAAPTPIHACEPAHPDGLCPATYACVEGACERMCSRFHWDGPCANEDEVCDRGVCVPPCSDMPGSGCEEGRCVEGECVLECGAIALPDNSCFDCAWDLFDSGQCEVAESCNACATCPSAQGPGRVPLRECECLQRDFCDGCEEAVVRYWDCIVDACPACGE